MSFIKNVDTFTITRTRADALTILEAGYASIDTGNAIRQHVSLEGKALTVGEHTFDLTCFDRLLVIAFGKCAVDASVVLEEILGDHITDGIVIDIRSGAPLKRLSFRSATHPLPSEQNIAAAGNVATLLTGATERDLVLVVVSGGGSSMLCLPNDMTCETLIAMTDALMKAGATIDELNTVRKHTSKIQGGQLAQMAYPATVVACIFSDVPGDDIGTIASGPTALDHTTKEDAGRILAKYDVLNTCALPHCELVETPKDPALFAHVTHVMMVTNRIALTAMREKAEALGYRAYVAKIGLEGEACDVGVRLVDDASRGNTCLLYGGETTVTIPEDIKCGRGGRAQEVALSALNHFAKKEMAQDTVIVAIASDGWDNGDVAGAIIDEGSAVGAYFFGLSPEDFLKNHDAYGFFERAGGHIVTGRTGMNVSDIYFSLTS